MNLKNQQLGIINYEKLYFTQYSHCIQYFRHTNISNKDLYSLITESNELLSHIFPNNLVSLPPYLLMLAYRDALIDILDEKYDNIN